MHPAAGGGTAGRIRHVPQAGWCLESIIAEAAQQAASAAEANSKQQGGGGGGSLLAASGRRRGGSGVSAATKDAQNVQGIRASPACKFSSAAAGLVAGSLWLSEAAFASFGTVRRRTWMENRASRASTPAVAKLGFILWACRAS